MGEIPRAYLVRPAVPDDADAACRIIRGSIEELCLPDHDRDPAILESWLANKTPDTVRSWIVGNREGVWVGEQSDGALAGVGAVLRNGAILLNYVAPEARFRGVSKALLAALESQARAWGCTCCTLVSTQTAHAFYRDRGYRSAGEPIASFGGKPTFPMRRELS